MKITYNLILTSFFVASPTCGFSFSFNTNRYSDLTNAKLSRYNHFQAFNTNRKHKTWSLGVLSESTPDISSDNKDPIDIPDVVEHVVFRQVYGDIMQHLYEFGHPNIPLGSTSGRKCKTLRRLYLENKLTSGEVALLEEIGFKFTSLEDVYDDADFDDIVLRLKAYNEENPSDNYQIPKKYKPDPELGSWVAMARRYGPEGVEPERRIVLDEIGFAWTSSRKCGSSFMKNYREIKEKLVESKSSDILNDDLQAQKWIRAQKEAHKLGNLSEARVKYMDQLKIFGVDWTEY